MPDKDKLTIDVAQRVVKHEVGGECVVGSEMYTALQQQSEFVPFDWPRLIYGELPGSPVGYIRNIAVYVAGEDDNA